MKTFKSLLCLATATVGLVGVANAATLSIENGSAAAGTEKNSVKIELKDSDLNEYNKVEFQLTVSNAFYIQVTNLQAGSTGFDFSTTQSGDIITYTFDAKDSTLSEQTLGEIYYRTSASMDNNVNINFANVKFYKKDGSSQPLTPGDNNVKATSGTIAYERPKSSEAVLTALVPSSGTLSPAFDSTITEYKIQIKDTLNTLRFTATPCQGATVSGDVVMRELPMGESTAEITVTAEDGTTNTVYKVTIIRGEITEPSAYLKDLVINNIGMSLSPKFDSKNNIYTVTIDKEISKLDFKYELEDPMADVKIEGNENFEVGENLVTIRVISSDEKDQQTYEITVIKEEKSEASTPVDANDKEDKEKKKGSVWLIVGIVIAILAIVGGVTFVLFKKKKDKAKKEEAKLPLKRREGSEKTVEIDRVDERPKHAATEETSEEEEVPSKEYPTEQESITEILKSELYEDDRTQRFDRDEFEDLKHKIYDEEDVEQTKEFNFKDFE